MEVERIFEDDSYKEPEVIYIFENDKKIIKHSDQKMKKFNINKWEEVNYIPATFTEVKRELTPEEKKRLKKYLKSSKVNSNYIISSAGIIRDKIKKIIKKKVKKIKDYFKT